MEKEECKKCDKQYSCIYLKNRFNTLNEKCGYSELLVTMIHQEELKERERILKEGEHIWKE